MAQRRGMLPLPFLFRRSAVGRRARIPQGMPRGGVQIPRGMQHGGINIPHAIQHAPEMGERLRQLAETMPWEARNPYRDLQREATLPMWNRAQLAARNHEIEEIRGIMDRRFSAGNPKAARHINDLRMLFFDALTNGRVRNFIDFEHFLRAWSRRVAEANPDVGRQIMMNANKYARELQNSFTRQDREMLKKSFDNLSLIARGGDPYD